MKRRLGTSTLAITLMAASLMAVGCKSSDEDEGSDGDGTGTGGDGGTGSDAGGTGDDGGTGGGTGGTGTGDGTDGGGTGGTGDGGSSDGGSGTTGDGTGTGGGELTCPVVIFCIEECADETCIEECFDAGSAEAIAEVEDFLACDEANMCDGDDQCLDDNCAAELTACFTGELGCDELSACADLCETECGNDQDCLDVCNVVCFYEGTADAQEAYDALVTCAEDNGCTDDMCLMDNCDAELGACFG